MKRVIQIIVQQVFYLSCISVALLICAAPSLITGPF
jgi:hypothetical protein